jgi:AraC-like DNA-binding protein
MMVARSEPHFGEGAMRKTVVQLAGGDLTSELVQPFRIESSVLCRSVMSPPWGFGVAARDAGSFHLVLAGEGWLEVEEAEGATHLRSGDLVLLPRGNAHRVKDAPGSAAPALTSILASHTVTDGELHFGGDSGPATEIVCGVFRVAGGTRATPAELLPTAVHLTAGDAAHWWPAVFQAVRDEARAPTAGGSAVVNRLLESLLADAMRGSIGDRTRSSGQPAPAALADSRLGVVLARMRDQPERPWSVPELARLAALSRSAFVDRFRSLVGLPPMRYVAQLRLATAKQLLQSTDATVADVAHRVGYRSEAAFGRAYRARFGVSPREANGPRTGASRRSTDR